MKVLVVFLALLTLDGACASEFSVRCEGRPPAGPYFATFDTNAGTVVFETASINAASLDGINILSGEISSFDERTDGKLRFAVRAPDGTISLTYDTKRSRMIWPGIIASDPFRPTLNHACEKTPPRSILNFKSTAPILHPMSVRCAEAGYMYFTMDAESKAAISEYGRTFRGHVVAVRGEDMELQFEESSPGRLRWSRSSKTITYESVDGKKDPPKQCEEIPPRTMIKFYRPK